MADEQIEPAPTGDYISEQQVVEMTHAIQASLPSELSSMEADDITQDSLVAVLEWVRRRQGFEGNLLNFATTVARNRVRNYELWRRRRAIESNIELHDVVLPEQLDPFKGLEKGELNGLITAALEELSLPEREILQWYYLDDLPAEEIARKPGIRTIQAVYHRRQVALNKLQKILDPRLQHSSETEGA